MIQIEPIKAFNDNYIWLVQTNEGVLVIDPGDSNPVIKYLTERNLNLDAILITHHHFDHTEIIEELVVKYSIKNIYGPHNCSVHITDALKEGFTIKVIGLDFNIIEVPGHTLDHIAFYVEHEMVTIYSAAIQYFSAGCGRVFEGTFSNV